MWKLALRSGVVRGTVLVGACIHACQYAHNAAQASTREVASFTTSGLVFKDTLKLFSLNDPKVEGVTIYLSDIELHTIDKVANFFTDPSSASITCVQTGPIKIRDDAKLGSEGEDIYGETRNLFFKQIRIRRIIDKVTNTLIYVAYTTRISTASDTNKSRFRSSVCALPLGPKT